MFLVSEYGNVEVTQKDRRKLIDNLERSGYHKIYCIF